MNAMNTMNCQGWANSTGQGQSDFAVSCKKLGQLVACNAAPLGLLPLPSSPASFPAPAAPLLPRSLIITRQTWTGKKTTCTQNPSGFKGMQNCRQMRSLSTQARYHVHTDSIFTNKSPCKRSRAGADRRTDRLPIQTSFGRVQQPNQLDTYIIVLPAAFHSPAWPVPSLLTSSHHHQHGPVCLLPA